MTFAEERGILLSFTENGVTPTILGSEGELVSPNEIDGIICKLLDYKRSITDDAVKSYNARIEYNHYRSESKLMEYTSSVKKKTHPGYVYLFKCADKYKIGFSKNVNRRLKQLDTRPFKLERIMEFESPVAYELEQRVHRIFKSLRVANEWYQFPFNFTADDFRDFLRNEEVLIMEEIGE